MNGEVGHSSVIDDGVQVVHRTDSNYNEVVEETKNAVVHFSLFNKDEVKKVRERAFRLSKKALWQHFITYYIKAYDMALHRAAARK